MKKTSPVEPIPPADAFPDSIPAGLRQMAGEVPEPKSFFSGICILQALVPDNIITYYRPRVSEIFPSHVSANYHHRFELLVVIDRGGVIRVGDGKYRIEPGEAFLIFPNQFHLYSGMGGDAAGWLFFTFNLHNSEVVRSLRDSPRKLDTAAFSCLNNLLQACVYPRQGNPDGLEVSSRLAELLRVLLACPRIPSARTNLRQSDDRRELIMEQINAYVRENLTKSLTIPALAESLGFSVSYLRAVFRERFGVSLGRYIRESRLSEAAQLLQDSPIKVTEVAERCGFESLVVFSRAFKNAFGISPKEYSKMRKPMPHLEND
jgi:AraC-like DNA-binding protein